MERDDTHVTIVEISEVELRDIMFKHITDEHSDLRGLTKPKIEYLGEQQQHIEPGFKCVFTFNNRTKRKGL